MRRPSYLLSMRKLQKSYKKNEFSQKFFQILSKHDVQARVRRSRAVLDAMENERQK